MAARSSVDEMKVLVMGHTGFIGSNMFNFLKRKKSAKPVGYSRSTGHDIFNLNQLRKFVKKCDMVYHFAAYAKPGESVTNPVKAIDTNVKGCLNVLEVCREFSIPIVYPSSCEIYGDSDELIREDFPLRPPNPYAASKAAVDRICFSYYKSYGLDVKIVRLFNPYGYNQQLNKIMPTFYFQAIENKPITVYGDGKDTRDYVFIDDIVRGLWLARKLPAGEAINLATEKRTTNLDLAKLILKLTKSDSKISFVEYPEEFGNIKNQVGCSDTARKILGWSPKVRLEEGVKKTIAWLKSLPERKR